MQLRLTRLVWITCAALLGIIALQVFWLYKAYQEQKTQLLNLVDNTLLETQIFTGVNAGLQHTAQSLMSDILRDFSKGNIPDSGLALSGKVYRIDVTDMAVGGTDMKDKLLQLIGLDSNVRKTYTLAEYKTEIAKSLSAKKVDIPFELALVHTDGKIIQCTGDSALFGSTGITTQAGYSLPITLSKGLSGQTRLAFPHALFYLLRGMWVILLLSLCLIFICAFSFSYMVALFYKQKRVAEIRNDFMNNMTHELKTPISSVSVALELLQDDTVTMETEARNEYFHIAGNELKRLTMLVDKVLRMAAFEKMEVNIKKEPLPVTAWIADVLQALKPLTEAGNITVAVQVEPETLTLFADRNHMTSVMQNLLENAIKYADKNKTVLQIGIDIKENGRYDYLTVTDNGMGIDRQYQSKIFDKFFRVPTGDEHETKGYGLGLSYVREIVRLHEGTISLESERKEGTTFTIILPKQQESHGNDITGRR